MVMPLAQVESFRPFLVTGPLMLLVAVVSVVAWRAATDARLRWVWAGALVWTVGVGLKVAWGLIANERILSAINRSLPISGYLAMGSLYVGLLTGVTEIGVTLLFALWWRGMTRKASSAGAVGVGAGAFEAALLGLSVCATTGLALSSLPAAEEVRPYFEAAVAGSALPWLVGPVERVLTIPLHVASRMLVLLAVRSRRARYFWVGFLLLTAVDALAGYVQLSGMTGAVSLWWVELGVAGFAAVAVALIVWCLRNWPAEEPAELVPEPAA